MLLTVTATADAALPDATDLGYLLHKHPGRVQTFDVSAGTAHVFYPHATPRRCTAALLLEIDPVALVRGRPGGTGRTGGGRSTAGDAALAHYVSDRPYLAGSRFAVTLGAVFRTALTGRCDSRPGAAAAALPLQLELPAVPCRGGTDLPGRLFGPLGWDVETTTAPLDPTFPQWGDAPSVRLRLTGRQRLADALNHLYVLLPVLDDAKHYWVSADEVDKLLRAGAGWLAGHPERELVTRRYLRRQGSFVRTALARLAEVDDQPESGDDAHDWPADDAAPPPAPPLARRRVDAVLAALRAAGAGSVLDLGCGEGVLLAELLADPAFTRVVGADVSHRALRAASRRLRTDQLPERTASRLDLWQTSLGYRDPRLAGFDAVVLMEVVEHLDPPRLPALEAAVFDTARPRTVVVTTPNVEYNPRYGLPAGRLRHPDHRFEWTRDEFARWAGDVAARHGYAVRFDGVGDDDADLGAPTQLAVFTR